MARTLKITLAYDGSRFVGWQRQARGTSIQGLLEEALAPLNGGDPVRVAGAGRTDAGVHALGQVASCRLRSTLAGPQLVRALNARLPEDVRVRAVEEAPPEFHARFSARRKTYAYHLLHAPVADPLARAWMWLVSQRLDVGAMRAALATLEGTHDFKAFQAAGSRVAETVRTLESATLTVGPWPGLPLAVAPGADRPDGDRVAAVLQFAFTGDGFLRHMVRNLVGTVVEVGLGRRPPEDFHGILQARDRRRAGPTAPAQGLVLLEVDY